MKINTLRNILFLTLGFLLLSLSLSYAQIFSFKNKLKVEVTDVNLNTDDTTIVIQYDLKGFRNRLYNTRLFYSNNRGNSFKGPLRSIKGQIGDSVKVGSNKEIRWNFRKDNPYFDGKDIMFKVEAIEVPKISMGGPENALRSILMPGLGDTKVRNGYNYGYIAAGTYACLGTGAIFYLRSIKKYNDYEDRIANSETEHNNIFNQAKRSRNLATGFFIAGGAIWLGDVIGVYFRGIQNKRRLAREREKAEQENTSSSLWKPSVLPATNGRFSSLTLLWKF